MKGISKGVIAAGLVGALSLGMVGCKTSSTVTTTVETTTTDENGSTTTTTSTQTTETGMNKDMMLVDEEGQPLNFNYINEYYKIAVDLPEGFTRKDYSDVPAGNTLEFYASDENGSEMWVYLTKDITGIEDVKDEESWANYYAVSEALKLETEGETDIKTNVEKVKIGTNVDATKVSIESKKEDKTMYRQIILIADAENAGISILLKTDDPDTLNDLNDKVKSYVLTTKS